MSNAFTPNEQNALRELSGFSVEPTLSSYWDYEMIVPDSNVGVRLTVSDRDNEVAILHQYIAIIDGRMTDVSVTEIPATHLAFISDWFEAKLLEIQETLSDFHWEVPGDGIIYGTRKGDPSTAKLSMSAIVIQVDAPPGMTADTQAFFDDLADKIEGIKETYGPGISGTWAITIEVDDSKPLMAKIRQLKTQIKTIWSSHAY